MLCNLLSLWWWRIRFWDRGKYEIGYKVVVKFGDIGVSVIWAPGAVNYRINSESKPRTNCGPLCVFETVECAKAFADSDLSDNCGLEIYECKYKRNSGNKIWRQEYGHVAERHLIDLPRGTALADSVILRQGV